MSNIRILIFESDYYMLWRNSVALLFVYLEYNTKLTFCIYLSICLSRSLPICESFPHALLFVSSESLLRYHQGHWLIDEEYNRRHCPFCAAVVDLSQCKHLCLRYRDLLQKNISDGEIYAIFFFISYFFVVLSKHIAATELLDRGGWKRGNARWLPILVR